MSTGAVYIFRGSKNLADIKPSQILYAEDFLNDKINRFGESLSGGLDIDSNNYPDLLIGAFPSNIVFAVRTYPIINLKASIENINLLQSIEQTSCSNLQINNKPCFALNLCFKIFDNQRNKNILNTRLPNVNYTLFGDSKQSYSRISFIKSNKEKYENVIDINDLADDKCELIEVNLNTDLGDYLTPITFSIDFNFDFNYENIENSKQNLQDINKYPVLNKDMKSADFEVFFKQLFVEEKKNYD